MYLKQKETFVCCSTDKITGVVGSRPNRFFAGSTSGDALYGVPKNGFGQCPKVSRDLKNQILGSFRFSDASRDRGAAADAVGDTAEPMDWSAADETLVQELIHRFRPKAVWLLSASCSSTASAIIRCGVPVIAFCPMTTSLNIFLFL
jgi:hypothetical protein